MIESSPIKIQTIVNETNLNKNAKLSTRKVSLEKNERINYSFFYYIEMNNILSNTIIILIELKGEKHRQYLFLQRIRTFFL